MTEAEQEGESHHDKEHTIPTASMGLGSVSPGGTNQERLKRGEQSCHK